MVERHIDSRDYDFLGMAGEMAQYCGKNQMAPKLTNRVQLVFEELVQQQLMSVLERPRIEVVVEYAQAEERSTLTARYNGPHRDVTAEGDELSLALLKGMVTQMRYTPTDDPEYGNQVVLDLKP